LEPDTLHEEPPVDPDRFDDAIRPNEIERLAERVVRRIPGLHAALTSGGWASLYDVSPDWQPVIGEIAPGIFVDAGTSGHGFKVAPMLAKHIADLIVGKVVDPALEDFDPFRFERGRPLAAGYRENRILG
jgi:glycine/D-amino acid oxidase-like deaminating enzyme